jgi:hypothetical protein
MRARSSRSLRAIRPRTREDGEDFDANRCLYGGNFLIQKLYGMASRLYRV